MSQINELLSKYDVLGAFWMTIKLTLLSAFFSLIVGTVIAVMRVCPIAVLRRAGAAYVNILRNTPLTLIIVFCNLGLFVTLGLQLADPHSHTSIADNNFRLAILGLSAYHASFVAEAIRSGVNTVPVGQAEAARSIGLGFLQTLRFVVLPQAFRGAIAPLGNTFIALTKNTTVAMAIGVPEVSYLMRGMIEFNSSLLFFIFLLLSFGFVVLTLPVGVAFTGLSRRLAVRR